MSPFISVWANDVWANDGCANDVWKNVVAPFLERSDIFLGSLSPPSVNFLTKTNPT